MIDIKSYSHNFPRSGGRGLIFTVFKRGIPINAHEHSLKDKQNYIDITINTIFEIQSEGKCL